MGGGVPRINTINLAVLFLRRWAATLGKLALEPLALRSPHEIDGGQCGLRCALDLHGND